MFQHSSDFGPRADWPTLRLRADLLKRVRSFFDERGFLEVETPVLSADIVVDRHLDPFFTVFSPDPRKPTLGPRLWLQTSPEFHMKRLLAAGSGPIYQVARVFRNAEAGPLHNPEFTMLEWYQPGVAYEAGMTFLSQVAETLLARGSAACTSYRDAFLKYADLDPHRAAGEQLRAAACRTGIATPNGLAFEDRDGWLDLLMAECVGPRLGQNRPEILFDYPASQAALAKMRIDDHGDPVAERFELYVAGIELANGYHELLDADVLRDRIARANDRRRDDGKPSLPAENRLLAAMETGLPPSVGVALGFDRLVMLAGGLSGVPETMAFPIDRA